MTNKPPKLLHGDVRVIGGQFDLRIMDESQDIWVQPTDAQLWGLVVNIMEYLADKNTRGGGEG